MTPSSDELQRRIQTLPDQSLAFMLDDDRGRYDPEALALAEVEAERRGLVRAAPPLGADAPDPQPPGEEPSGTERTVTPAESAAALRHVEAWVAAAVGPARSDRYPALGVVAVALRLLSFAFAAVAAFAVGAGLFALVVEGPVGWFEMILAAFRAAFLGLVLFGAAELVRVVLDIEANTRAGRAPDAQPPDGPGTPA